MTMALPSWKIEDEVYQFWRDRAFNAAPATNEECEAALRALYALTPLGAPKVTWVSSPRDLLDAAGVIAHQSCFTYVGAELNNEMAAALNRVKVTLPRLVNHHVSSDLAPFNLLVRGALSLDAPGALEVYSHVFQETRITEMLSEAAMIENQHPGMLGAAVISWVYAHATLLTRGLWYPATSEVVICEAPITRCTDRRGRPHNLTGPALTYADGFSAYAYHGMRLSHAAANPSGIVIDDAHRSDTLREALTVLSLGAGDPDRLALAEVLVPASLLSVDELRAVLDELLPL
jgi:hypothetical protein